MRSKRLLTMLLALCLVISAVSPAVNAVDTAGNSYVNTDKVSEENVTNSNVTTSPFLNDLLVSDKDGQTGGLNTLRDVLTEKLEAGLNGSWDFSLFDGELGISVLPTKTPDCLEELKKAAEVFEKDEVVSAFVVMEGKPLAESYTSPTLVSSTLEKQMIEKQDAVISAIEKVILKGEKLEVRYQFTYLTNSFTINTEFANLEKIAALDGVKSVFVMPVYEPTATSTPNTAASGAMTGVNKVWDLEYTGEGMKIAIVDTGLDLDHPSFSALDSAMVNANSSYLSESDIAAVLQDLNIYSRMQGRLTAGDLYRSTKVPYAFNYVDVNLTADHSADGQGDHGTHVAGIAAANATEGTTVVGMAPDAQIIVMKVFGANGGAYTDDYVAAIEDAMTLGCDAVNLSLGSPAGFSSTDTEIDLIFQRLECQDIIATISAGNETNSSYGNMWGTDLNRTQNPENGVVGAPSTYANTFSIASAENSVVMTNYFTLADGTKLFYMDSIEYLYGDTNLCMAALPSEELEYVIVPNLGAVEDMYDAEGNSIVEGKVAVIKRGELSFSEKAMNAANAGAAAVIIWNNNDDDDIFTFGMTTANEEGYIPGVPVCLISLSDGNAMEAAEVKTLTPSADMAERLVEGGQMSSFSSWGTTSDLRLVPDITGIGGNVYSCYDGGQYGLMSGTSMSAPQLAGVSALVMQYLHEKFPNATDGEIRELALALMMSTADPIISNDSGLEASPRQQGAGLVDAAEAVTSDIYLTVGGDRPKVELGDNSTGNFVFSFEIHNIGTEAKTYTLGSSLLTEDVVTDGFNYYMAGYDRELSGSVVFDKDTVTVAAGGVGYVTVTVTLSEEDKAYFAECWENGGYVEGYIYLKNADGAAELNLPFFGFYGDWTDAPVFDTAYWYDNSFWSYAPADGLPEGDQYYNVFWTMLGGSDWVLGMNPVSGAILDENGQVIYDPANNSVSPNGDGLIDGIDEIYLSLLRNAKTMDFIYTVDGEIVHAETFTNNPKTMYISNYGQIVPWLYSWYGTGMYDFTDANGNVLPNGTEVLLTITASIDYEDGGENVIQIPITVDTGAPVLENVYELPQEDGSQYIAVEVSENVNLAGVTLMNPNGTRILGQEFMTEQLENGNYVVYFDITDLGTDFLVVLCDYAANESYYEITYTADPEGNRPELDTSLLYGYRVSDSILYSYLGYDYQFGWISMNKPEDDIYGYGASIIYPETSEYLEYYALNAAEYAGGMIFAVDAGYNFLVMEPGLWNRQTIANLGVNVVDMAFDDTTDTMYVVTCDEYDYISLHTIDLLTGEMSWLKTYYWGAMPWAITVADDGTIYAIARESSNLYTVNKDNNYSLETVNDETGTSIVITDSYGSEANPYYSQSITYQDGKIYWAYYQASWSGTVAELITIDTTNGYTFSSVPYISVYPELGGSAYSDTEIVGLLTLDETEYQIPAAETLQSMLLDNSRVVIGVGKTAEVNAIPVPWNYQLTDLVWTSSDETVATVEDGVITGVAEGDTIITVSHGDITTECVVTVVNVEGHFNAYNYYSADGYYGYMIDVDMGTMDYYLTALAPVDFIAGDYNGHDGCFYGYTEGGQLYRYNLDTGMTEAVGMATGINPSDMAYDYSTGYMYAAAVDGTTGMSTLYTVDMKTGKLIAQAEGNDPLMTLACDAEGNLYSVTAYGDLIKLIIMDGYIYAEEYILSGLGELQYQQSMCYDHANDVLIWTCPELSTVYWIDHNNEAEPYVLDLGDPSESGTIEFLGMYTVPAEIPVLPNFAVEDVLYEDMFMLVGEVGYPNVTVLPLNANGYTMSLTSSDEDVVAVVDGAMLYAVASGTAQITVEIVDTFGGDPISVTVNVKVAEGIDNLRGYMMTDMATYGGYYWTEIPAMDPKNHQPVAETIYTIYAEEYYNGKVYAVGYDDTDWSANWQMLVMDAVTMEVENMIDLGPNYPFVYDMTYDYTTSTMYCVAGPGSDASDLYIMDMETGALTLLLATDEFFMNLAAGPDGVLYAIAQSETIGDAWDPWAPVEVAPANIYTIDPVAGEVELLGSTGMNLSGLASLTYDYDTDYLYWSAFDQNTYVGGLTIIDPTTGAGYLLDSIGAAGAMVTGLYTICENYPEETDTLHAVLSSSEKLTLYVGDSVSVNTITVPMNIDVDSITWSSSDESVVTVDANGVITAVAEGNAVITVTVTKGDVTVTDTCVVTAMDANAAFLTYNVTDGGWSVISRKDMSVVTNLTEAEDLAEVTAVANVGDDIYGYDVNLGLFKLNTTTFEREYIATEAGIEIDTENGFAFEIRDMAYDEANERMLVLGVTTQYDDYFNGYYEIYGGTCIYSVDLTTGVLTEEYFIDAYYAIKAMTVDTNGTVYFYSNYDDSIVSLNTTTGETMRLVTTQSESIYGSENATYAMYYDELTGSVYLLFCGSDYSTGNYGDAYSMFTVDPATGMLTKVSDWIGDNVEGLGDDFNGLVAAPVASEPVKVNPFTDVAEDKYYYDAVLWAVEEGITTGKSDTLFAPDASCTRAQVVTFLWRAAGCPEPTITENPFTDVSEDSGFYKAILWAYSEGITTGKTATTFAPNATVTRAQFVTFLWRAMGSPAPESTENHFTDVQSGAYYYNAVLWAVEEGITTGKTDTTFATESECTRAQAVTFIYRALVEAELELA